MPPELCSSSFRLARKPRTTISSVVKQAKINWRALIHHQNATCCVAFSPMALRRMPNTPQALGLLRLAAGILLVLRELA